MYTSKIIRVPRNNSVDIDLPFQANYLYLKVVNIEGDQKIETTPIILKLDDGEDIIMISALFQLDYNFRKLTIKIGEYSLEDIPFFYFISGEELEQKKLLVELQNKLEELETITEEENDL